MNHTEKQLKYSIRKVSVGAASVVIGALYLLMGAGIAHAEGVESARETERTANPTDPEQSGNASPVNGTVYEASPARSIEMSSGKTNEEATDIIGDTSLVSGKEHTPSGESNDSGVSLPATKEISSNNETEKKETESSRDKTEDADKPKTRRKRSLVSTDIKYQPKVDGEKLGEAKQIQVVGEHQVGDSISYVPEEIKSGIKTYVPVLTGPKSITLTDQPQTVDVDYVDKAVADAINKRKGAVFSKNHDWVRKDDTSHDGDENAHLTFELKDGATIEEMFKAIENLPDDFQNNERSYLRNMDTLGDAVGLQPGEIKELTEFGGWKAIDGGKFVIGKRNKDGYFTGWRRKEDGTIEQGGMLGGDGLDNVYVHEQALDRRFKYMLMLAKGRTRANRTEEVSDGKDYDPRAANERYSGDLKALDKLPPVEKDKYTKYSPNVKGFNGIEKKFTAFSTKYGSRVKVEFVTGYISDINGSKGTYRVVVKAQKSDGTEETVYDQTVHRIDTVVQNEDLYKKGLKLEPDGSLREADATRTIKKILEYELNHRSNEIQNKKLAEHRLNKKVLSEEEKNLKKQLSEEAKEEAKQSDIVMEVSEEALKEDKLKETLPGIGKKYIASANELNNFLKTVIKEPTDPTWTNAVKERDKAHDPDRVYKLLRLLLPQASKITYHPEEDRLEIENNYVSPETKTILEEIKEKNEAITATKDETERKKLVEERDNLRNKLKDKYSYTYLQAHNGKETIIQGSTIRATGTANEYDITENMLARTRTNTIANSHGRDGIVKGGEEYGIFGHIVGTDKIERPAHEVLTDDQLSNKIKEKLGEGDSKLGKGGYFSSGDIPLGKDVVSYTVQVFSADNERVGVNPQSHRVQYNLPILADFSVIQDTVEPAKEVSRRIIDKLIEEKKIPEDKGKKIKEEIEKVKKTSELKELLKGSVKVRYVDTTGTEIKDAKYLRTFTDKDGNTANITDKPGEVGKQLVKYLDKSGNPVMVTVKIKDNNNQDQEVSVPKEEETTDNKAGYLGLSYTDTFDKTVDNIISTSDGKRYRVRRSLADNTPERAENSAAAAGELSPGETVVTYVYEEIPESVEDTETKTLTRTIKYVEKGNETHLVSESKTQTVTVSRKVYKNKQTGKVEAEEAWEIPDGTKWEEVVSPKLDGYQNPTVKVGDRYEAKDKVDSVTITQEIADRGNVEETVYYEVDAVKTTETKTITRTIRYVDNVTKQKLKEDVVQTVTLTREKTENKAAGTTTYTEWTKGNWEKVVSPTIDKYTNPSMTEVSSMEVTSDSKNSTITVTYDQGTETTQETKPVTRTIKYVKKDFVDGVEVEVENAQQTNTKAVSFTRTLTRNLVTGETTTGTWSEKQTLEEVKTPVLEGYVADRAKVESSEVTGDSADIEEKVVYRKIGGWIPKEPGKDKPTPIPYPNDPDDPTKPKTPTYPETPDTPGETPNPQPGDPGTPETPATPPVIPYVPGYTPKVPTDPTKPENPDTNPLKPLEPLDPNDPKKGYKVPEIPSDPKKNKEIEYVPNPQKILIKVVNITTGKEVEMPKEKLEFSGVSDQVVGDKNKTKVDDKIKALRQRGYTVESTNPITATTKYDRVDDATTGEPSQTYKILVKEPISIDTDSKTVTRTIKYVKKDLVDGVEVPSEAHETVTDRATFNREIKFNLVTGETTYGEWSEAQTLNKVASPVLSGYIADRAEVGEREVTATTEDIQEEVVYTKIGTWVPNLPSGETPIDPIPYPNHPTDPTKPGDPTPGVIPHVPGYTPKIGETPLEPKVPGDPSQGYTPPKPSDPKSNTAVTYEPDPQKALVKVVNTTTGVEVRLPAEDVNLEGRTAEKISTEKVLAKITNLEKRGFIVDNKDEVIAEITKSSFDKQKDEEGKDPSQVFTLKIHEKVVEVTEPPTPNTPIDPDTPDDPNNPSIPRWTEELVNQLSLKKDVTRTITYVKKDTPNGEEIPNAKPTVTQTAHFKRNVKVNVATRTVVEYTDWTSTDKNLAEVTTEKLDGYVADKLSVASVTVSETSNNLVEKVIYTKLGAWIPKIPKGVVPPEGTDTNPKPYPNHPTDPTKPGNPTDPNVPVIPYIPGYTPKIGETPLQPKVPGDPTKGYIPPAVPTEPNTNTEISYLADPQRAVVKVVNVKEGKEIPLPNDTVAIGNGSTDADIPKDDVNKKITDLEKRGYVVENKDLLDNQKFDNVKDPDDGDPTQVFTLKVHEKVVPVTPPTPDKPIEPGTPIDPTTPVDPDKPNDPTIPRWTEDLVKQLDTKKEVTRTITYVDEEGAKVTYTANGQETTDAVTDKVTFTRTAFINVVTKTITYGEWMAVDNDTTFAAVLSPMVKGYVLKANQDTQGGLVEASGASVVASEHLKADSANQELKVVYTKLGSWIPKVPGEDTPTPLPYPNHPTDPTKPGDPTDPNTPNVPVIPYVPGYTPKIGETPLQPKVPGDPTKGYIPPSIPTEPGTDKEISYVPDSQRALVKVYNVKDGVKIPLENDTVGINDGKTDQAIPTKSLEDKIKELEKRGYTVDNKDLLKGKVFDNQKDPENGDPTQVYDLLVRERISFDTETKAVTRTIKYVKIEEQNGAEVEVENAQPTNTQTVNFSRDISINLATGRISNGKWSEKQILGEVKTPVLEGYLADKVKVESREVTGDSESFVEKVVYRKIGSWVPKVPGKEEPTPIPYPNDPDDPTKPKTPDYPTTPPQPGQPVPKVPVIPYVPGYTPKTPNGTPLVPIDPEHPEKGYKVPPVPETPNDPKMDTPIKYTPDGQRAIVKFVVIGEDGKETELVASRMSLTGKTGEKIPTENFNDTLKKLTGDPVNNGDYELVDNPLKDGATFDNVKDEEGKDPSQVFVVKLRQIYVIPPTPRIVERPSGNTVEVDVPNKDADTLSITFTKRNSTEKETIVTKKDKDGTWKIEKSPVGVTINPTNGRVYIPSEQVQPKTWVDTQTKHKYKQSKIVSVMPNILDVPKFEGTTEWIDVNGNVLRPTENGLHEKGRIANHVWLESRLEGNKVTHIFFAGSPSVDKPEYKITVWFDKDGNPLKPDQPGTHEAGNIPGYRYITTVTEDGITIHRFEKIPPVLPNEPIPDRPEEPRPQPNPEHPSAPTPSPELPNQETPIPEPTPEPETPVSPDPEVPTYETGKREELPNTGTEANAGLAGAGLLTLLAGLGLGFFKKKEDESE
nr:YSIRK-type signal peptide-containing protein [Streptococcus sp. 4094]